MNPSTFISYSRLASLAQDPVEGLGQYYKSIMTKKSDLVKCGKWIDDDIF